MNAIIVTVIAGALLLTACTYVFYYTRWRHLWALLPQRPAYAVSTPTDDTLRVAIIGDSWAGMRTLYKADDALSLELSQLTGRNVAVASCGKGGEKTHGIYSLMFLDGEYGTRPLLQQGANYCVVFAGINDATACLGTRQYTHYYRQILHLLLQNNIRPVVVEIPNVDIWHLYGHKPLYDRLSDFVKSTMTRTAMYSYQPYREALKAMLSEQALAGKVVFVGMDSWNPESPAITNALFLNDRIHLNATGYQRLDASIARAIADDLKQPVDATLADEPVGSHARQR